MVGRVGFVVVIAVVGCGSESLTPVEFRDEELQARACSPGDTCAVFLSTSQCVCSMAVNARDLARLTMLAAKVECGSASALCVDVPRSPSCVDGFCDNETTEPDSDGGLADAGAD